MIVNGGFEVPGVGAGQANGWTFTSVVTPLVFADYVGGPWESFEAGWVVDYVFALTLNTTMAAEYQSASSLPKFVENFEEFWDTNQSYSYGVVGTPAMYSTNAWESFNQQWDSNESYLYDLGIGVVDAVYSGGGDETFAHGWDSNQSYVYAFVGVGTDLTAAVYTGVVTAEAFLNTEWSLMATV